MIHTDGIRTIANRPPVLGQVTQAELDGLARARALREYALEAQGQYEDYLLHYDREFDDREPLSFEDWLRIHGPVRGAQDNGIDWNDDACNCGGEIADSPAGDKCWDCFNHEPGE